MSKDWIARNPSGLKLRLGTAAGHLHPLTDSVWFHTFGCKANQYETEVMRPELESRGVSIAPSRSCRPCVARSLHYSWLKPTGSSGSVDIPTTGNAGMRITSRTRRADAARILAATAGAIGLLILPGSASAQVLDADDGDIEGAIATLTTQDAALFIRPVTNGLGAGMNTAWFSTAGSHGLGGFDLGVRIVGAFVPAEDELFSPSLPGSIIFQGQAYSNPYGAQNGGLVATPTATGDGTGLTLVPQGEFRNALVGAGQNPDNFDVTYPDGFDFPFVPFAAIQGAVGVGGGAEVILRWVPSFEPDPDVGSISMFGFGLKYSLDRLVPRSPVRLAVAYGHTEFDVGDYLSGRSNEVSLIGSLGTPIVTVYGAATYEDSDFDVQYTFENPNATPGLPADGELIQFEQDGANSTRLTLGTTLGFGPGRLNVDYAVANYNVLSVGLLFSFR